VSYC